MKSGLENNIIFAKLDDGEDLFGCIQQLVQEHGITSGIILSNIGMLKDFELNFFKDGRPVYPVNEL